MANMHSYAGGSFAPFSRRLKCTSNQPIMESISTFVLLFPSSLTLAGIPLMAGHGWVNLALGIGARGEHIPQGELMAALQNLDRNARLEYPNQAQRAEPPPAVAHRQQPDPNVLNHHPQHPIPL